MIEEYKEFLKRNDLKVNDIILLNKNNENYYVRLLYDGRLRHVWPLDENISKMNFANGADFLDWTLLKKIRYCHVIRHNIRPEKPTYLK